MQHPPSPHPKNHLMSNIWNGIGDMAAKDKIGIKEVHVCAPNAEDRIDPSEEYPIEAGDAVSRSFRHDEVRLL